MDYFSRAGFFCCTYATAVHSHAVNRNQHRKPTHHQMNWHYFTTDELIESARTKKWLCYRQTGWKREGAGGYRSGNYYVATTGWMMSNGFSHLLEDYPS